MAYVEQLEKKVTHLKFDLPLDPRNLYILTNRPLILYKVLT